MTKLTTKHYYGICHAYKGARSDGDKLYQYDSLNSLRKSEDLSDGKTTRCTLDYARHNFRVQLFVDNPWDECIDQYGDQYAPAKPCYTE